MSPNWYTRAASSPSQPCHSFRYGRSLLFAKAFRPLSVGIECWTTFCQRVGDGDWHEPAELRPNAGCTVNHSFRMDVVRRTPTFSLFPRPAGRPARLQEAFRRSWDNSRRCRSCACTATGSPVSGSVSAFYLPLRAYDSAYDSASSFIYFSLSL